MLLKGVSGGGARVHTTARLKRFRLRLSLHNYQVVSDSRFEYCSIRAPATDVSN